MLLRTSSASGLRLSGSLDHAGLAPPAGDYAETKQKTLKLPEDVSADALELLLHGIYDQEVGSSCWKACICDAAKALCIAAALHSPSGCAVWHPLCWAA